MSSSYVYDQVKLFAVSGDLSFNNVPDGNYRVALCNDVILDPSYSKKTKWSDISQYEISNLCLRH